MGSGENLPVIDSQGSGFEMKIIVNYFPANTPRQPELIENYFLPSPASQEFDLLKDKLSSPEEAKSEDPNPFKASPPKLPGSLKRLHRKILPSLQRISNKLLNLLRHYASWVGFLQTLTSALLEKIPALILRITDYISPVGRVINGLKLVYRTLFHCEGNWTRRLSLLVGFGSVGLGIAAILVPPFGLVFATINISNNTFLSLWVVAVSLKNKLALRNSWKAYDLSLMSALPPTGPVSNTLYVDFKNNRLSYRVKAVDEEVSLGFPILVKNLGLKRARLLIESLKKSKLNGKLDELYPFQKDILKLAAKKRKTPWKTLRTQIEEDEKEFYSELAEPRKLEKYLQFKNKDASVYQDETNLKLSELEQRILKKKNQERKLNAHLATQVYNAGIMALALTGIILSFFPPTIIAGACILLATSIHGILFGYDLSGKWPQQMQNYFFGDCSTDSADDLEKKTAAYKKKYSTTAVTELTLRSHNRSATTQSKPKSNEPPLIASSQKTSTEQTQTRSNTLSIWQKFLSKQSEQISPSPPAAAYLDVMPIH